LRLKQRLPEISAEDEGAIVKGSIDVLVIQKRFWVLVIEAKSTKFDVLIALPQALAYMLNDPNPNQLILVCLSMVGNIKLIQQNQPQ